MKKPARAPSGKAALVADDHELMRVALARILETSLGYGRIVTVSSFDDASGLLAAGDEFDLILLDLTMPGMDGHTSVLGVRRLRPAARLAVVSGSLDRMDMVAAVAAGANGYVPKALSVDEMTEALRRIDAGQVYLPPMLASVPEGAPALPAPLPALPAPEPVAPPQARAPRRGRPPKAPDLSQLTPRQMEVLAEIRKGLSNNEIAHALNLGYGTVKVHVAGLFKALGVRNRAEAVEAAARGSAS